MKIFMTIFVWFVFVFFTVNMTPFPEKSLQKKEYNFGPRFNKWKPHIVKWSKRRGIDPRLVAALSMHESPTGNMRKRGLAGERCVMQIMAYNAPQPERLYEPDYCFKYGTLYLSMMIKKKPTLYTAISAYNTGPNTRRINHKYVERVLDNLEKINKGFKK